MNFIKLILTIILITFIFTGCTTKSQTDVLNSSKQDVTELLSQLIEKEKEINQLKKELNKYKTES